MNAHIERAIADYVRIDAPGYALLVDGAWGAGKTHLVNRLRDAGGSLESAIYVSCFGLENMTAFESALAMAMHPSSSKTAGLFRRILAPTAALTMVPGVKETAGAVLEQVEKVLAEPRKGIYVLDDLERSNLHNNNILGFVDFLLERYDAHVILVANVGEWQNANPKQFERVVGETLRVIADIGSAADSFVYSNIELDDVAAKAILDTFRKSTCHNLRTLRYVVQRFARHNSDLVLWEASDHFRERFFAELTWRVIEHRTHPEWDLRIEPFFAVWIRMRAEREKKEHTPDEERFLRLSHQHGEQMILSTFLRDEFWVDCIYNWKVDEGKLRELIYEYGIEPPLWEQCLDFPKLTDSKFQILLAKMDEKFESESAIVGQLHHISTRLWNSEKTGVKYGSLEVHKSVVMRKVAEFNIPRLLSFIEMDLSHGAAGYSYLSIGNAEFSGLISELKRIAGESLERKITEAISGWTPDNFLESIGSIGCRSTHLESHKDSIFRVLDRLDELQLQAAYIASMRGEAPGLGEVLREYAGTRLEGAPPIRGTILRAIHERRSLGH
ncbi:hypothetical protein FRD01_13220 [Microvenator marinus]|uniref:KAP NTPase domain-containing protein n=1 Tax=Microvenator marinus TaxID=2600177 RepID=A0A5B8XRK2_9DELT|nr:P-loop NTPase fold protein [Microvenator marinus]QED28174.1 hypothetical protein FRD01_13220 [Microvenator marinus]